MSKDILTDAIGGIGDDLIAEAKARKPVMIYWRRIAAAAACLALIIGAFCLASPKSNGKPGLPILQNTTAPPNNPTTVMPSTNNGQTEIPVLVIRSAEQYDQLLLAAEDQSEFLQHPECMYFFNDRDELKHFLNTIRHLPIPQIEGADCTFLEYIPIYGMLNITYQSPDGKRYSFTFELDANRALEIREDFAKRGMLSEEEWAVPGSITFKTITEFKKLYTIFDVYGCWMDINGMLVNFSCDGLTGNVTAEAVFAQLSIGNTLSWK